ncbi:MAG: hypothetical protein FWF87_04310 [Synergistaceae bacterium]|nr:hypothetical protein [Synergistaceae bacterium]
MRLIILMLSIGSVVAFGHALAGFGVKLLGMEINYPYLIGGLSGGTISAILALWLWKRWLQKEKDRD